VRRWSQYPVRCPLSSHRQNHQQYLVASQWSLSNSWVACREPRLILCCCHFDYTVDAALRSFMLCTLGQLHATQCFTDRSTGRYSLYSHRHCHHQYCQQPLTVPLTVLLLSSVIAQSSRRDSKAAFRRFSLTGRWVLSADLTVVNFCRLWLLNCSPTWAIGPSITNNDKKNARPDAMVSWEFFVRRMVSIEGIGKKCFTT